VADAVLGPAASAGLRHVMLQRLRATVAGASVAWFMMHHMALTDGLVHLDFEHDFVHSAKLVRARAGGGLGWGLGLVGHAWGSVPHSAGALEVCIWHGPCACRERSAV
jgi:hypothetical protein